MKKELETLAAARQAAAACPHHEPVPGGDSGQFLIDPDRWGEDSAWRDMSLAESEQHAKFVAWRSAQNVMSYATHAAADAVRDRFEALSDAQKLAVIRAGEHAVRYSNSDRYPFTVLTKHGKRWCYKTMGEGTIYLSPEYVTSLEDWEAFGWRMLGLVPGQTTNPPPMKIGDLQVWWMPQVPMEEMFIVDVGSVVEGVKVMDILADYDKFQFENRIKSDYANCGGIRSWCGDNGDGKPGWEEWYDDETGLDDPRDFLRDQENRDNGDEEPDKNRDT